jgi:membrane fusion protein
MTTHIFRKEAIDRQNDRLWGEVIISQPISYGVLTALMAIGTALACFFLFTNEYTRMESVTGLLVPGKGVVAVYPPQPGLLSELYAAEGDFIEQGSDLFKIQIDQRRSSADYISREVLRELGEQKTRLATTLQLEHESLSALLARQDNNIKKFALEITALHAQIATQTEMKAIEDTSLARAQELLAKGVIAKSDMDNVAKNSLDKQQQLQNLQLTLDNLTFELEEAKIVRNTHVINSRREIAELENHVSEINTQIATAEVEQSNIIRAPVSGTITAITANLGQKIESSIPVITIIPEDSRLEAHLYIPTRAIGFITEGQHANLRFEAFPYQRFGLFTGSIRQVTHSVLSQNELPGLLPIKEPVYRITATLDNQTVDAYGQQVALRPGMLLSADIQLDKRSLLEWLLAPLYSLKGRL